MFNKRKSKIIARDEEDWENIYKFLISRGYFYIGERNKNNIFIIDEKRRTFETTKEKAGGFLHDTLRFKKRTNK